jgi:group I intron endonuclease
MKISGIYQIKSRIKPGRIYIGSAVDISNRWRLHLSDLKKKKHHSPKLQAHFNKYGETDLTFSILLGCNKEDLIKTEQYFIDSYNPYFNHCKIAGSCLGYKKAPHTEEAKKKMSDAMIGHVPWNKGRKNIYSEATIMKMSDAKNGSKLKQSTKDKISNSNKGKKRSEQYSKYLSERNIKNGVTPPSRKGKFKYLRKII